MTRREKIEQIIIGSLLCEFGRHYPEVRGIITPDMMSDPRNAKALTIMERQHGEGIEPDIATVAPEMMEDAVFLVEATNDGDFETNKAYYNLLQDINGTQNYTMVEFGEYITQYIKLYEREKE